MNSLNWFLRFGFFCLFLFQWCDDWWVGACVCCYILRIRHLIWLFCLFVGSHVDVLSLIMFYIWIRPHMFRSFSTDVHSVRVSGHDVFDRLQLCFCVNEVNCRHVHPVHRRRDQRIYANACSMHMCICEKGLQHADDAHFNWMLLHCTMYIHSMAIYLT